MAGGMVAETFGGVVADGGGHVEAVTRLDRPAVDGDSLGIKEVVLPPFDLQRPLKTLLPRVTVDMPLAGVVGAIAGRREQLRQEPRPGGPPMARIAPLDPGRGVAADRLGVVAGEQGAAGRPAAGGVVALRELEAAGRKLIKMGRVDLAAVAAEIGKAEIVGEDHDDIGGCGVAAHRCGECQHDW
jgi:hypothetical protein